MTWRMPAETEASVGELTVSARTSVEPRELVLCGSRALSAEVSDIFSQALDLLNLGEAKLAACDLERVVAAYPDYADARIALGIAYAMTSRIYPALDNLKKATELEKNNFFAHFKLAHLYFKLRVPKEGYQAISQAWQCAETIQEKRLVAQLLKEERQRERGEIQRPDWGTHSSMIAFWLAVAMGILAVILAVLRVG